VPRAFFVFLPLFALFLELLYRAGRVGSYLPAPVRAVIGLTLAGWLFAYLPIALRQVYGGSRLMTGVNSSRRACSTSSRSSPSSLSSSAPRC